MAVKSIQMYRRQLDGTETDLNPLTESQYVLMDNGQTVQEVLSDRDSDKYTPVITNSSSTFKVGQGDSVDLSSSMKEGAYDSCVLKGKTMVNCIQEPSSQDVVLPYEFEDGQYVTINDTKESGALGVELKGQTLVNVDSYYKSNDIYQYFHSHNIDSISDDGYIQLTANGTWRNAFTRYDGRLKPSTKYLVVVDVKTNTLADGTQPFRMFTEGTNSDGISNVALAAGQSKWIGCGETGVFKYIVTTASDLSNAIVTLRNYVSNSVTSGVIVYRTMMIEYQEGMENWDIPFFTGITSCKMPILHTNGKNLLPYNEMFVSPFTSATPYITKNVATFPFTLGVNGRGVGIKFKVEPNTTYTLSSNVVIPNTAVGVAFYKNESDTTNHNNKLGIAFSTNIEESTKTFTTPNECNWIVCGMYILYTYEQSGGTVVISEMPKLQLEKNTQATTYEPHKSSILSLPEEVVLRSLPNGVCDTFNTRTGVYTQRIYETKFVPSLATSNNQWVNSAADWTNENARGVYVNFDNLTVPCPKQKRSENVVGQYILCDKLKQIPRSSSAGAFGGETKGIVYSSSYMGVMLPKSELREDSKESVLEWLETNQCSIVYELETPIVTKINLPSILKSWNTTTHIYSEIPENTLHPTLSHSNPTYPVILKPSTKYSIVANSYSNDHTNSAINFNLGGATATTTVGNRVTTITTPSTLSNELLTMSGRGNKLNNVMVIEGDVVGDEPYFEGICDSKSPILSNVGKNLFDEQRHSNPDNFFVHSAYWSIPIRLKGNTEYRFSYTFNNVLDKQVVMRFATCKWTSTDHSSYPYSLGQVLNRNITSNLMGKTDSMSFVTPADGLVYLHYYNTELTNSPSSFNLASWYTHILKDIQLEESSTSTQCEPYKSNTTTFDQKDNKTIVLRSLPNGVCDTLNVETGEYVQRIGEAVFDGSNDELWSIANGGVKNNTIAFGYIGLDGAVKGTYALCDKFVYPISYPEDREGIQTQSSNLGQIYISIFNSKLPTLDSAGFKQWLSQNPVTVQYELATPIVSTIDIQGFPYAYTNGHVQLSSGHSGQSLTPTVEYSLSANKTGQINSNTKRVSTHQKQLDDFEAMMLTSMVQSAYDKAILQFDYEMQMMSLGGE